DLDQALEEEPEFRALRRDDDPKVRQMMQYAEVLEGAARHTGVHAAGVIIAPGDVSDYVPISTTKSKGERIVTTQYDGDWIEEFGLLKMDFLGLKTLTILEDALELIEENHGDQIDLGEVPLDDAETFELFQRGDTTGIFQFESTGMREWLRKLEPTEVNDLIAMNALYRPGPMDLIPDYVARKHGEEPVEYPHPLLEDVLEPTYGIAVFQEQVMEMARLLAGFSLGEADILRRAMGKKDQKKMAKQREAFVRGCAEENGIGEGEANELFDIIAKFAGYGFNKCVTGDTEIVDASTGRRVKVIDIVEGREPDVTVASLGEERLEIEPRRVTDAFSSGEAQTYALTTRTGRQVQATSNHPVYTPEGWTPLGDLAPGDRVAVPRHVPYEPSASWEEHELVVLGYALAKGNLCHPHSFCVYPSCEEELADYRRHLERFDNTAATVDRSKSAASIYARRGDRGARCAAVDFIEELGLKGLTATEKRVPDAAFRLPKEQLAVLLGRLWTGDGCICPEGRSVYYATSSERLARDVQHVLLRLEIPSTIHERSFSYHGEERPGYALHVSTKEIEAFARQIGPHLVGKRRRDLDALLGRGGSTGPMTPDVVPMSVFPEMKNAMRMAAAREEISMKELMRRADASYKLLFLDKRKKGHARETIGKIAEATENKALERGAESDVYWDEVSSVEENSVEEVYDLTVEGTHNFVAGDLVVHNSHSAAYSLVAYRTAFLKAHYPAEFMAAAMTNDLDKTDKLTTLLEEADQMNLDVLPPSVNRSAAHFTVDEGQIRFGLGAIKGVGMGAVESIVEARDEGSRRGGARAFEDLFDLVEEIDLRQANKRVIEALARAGAMDELEGHRAQLVKAADDAVSYGQKAQADAAAGQNSLFGDAGEGASEAMQPSLPDAEPWPKARALKEEREVTGFYVSGHPLESFRAEAEAFATAKLGQTERFDQQGSANAGGDGYSRQRGPKHAFCGILTEVDFNTTRKGKPIGFATLEDFSGRGDLVIFASVLDRVRQYLNVDDVVLVKGETEVRGGTTNVVVNEIVPMWKVREQMVKSLTLRLDVSRTDPSKIRALRRLCEDHLGNCQLYFNLEVPGLAEPQRVRSRECMVEPTPPLMKGIRRLFGEGRLSMQKRG
ncbi:MAG: DNA polymerase III subunit alpha, partial [Bacteroidetes bacterium QS_9_68_14]